MSSSHMMPTLFGRVTAILGDHADLSVARHRLLSLCAGDDAENSTTAAARSQLIEEFAERMRAHFLAEEDEGYFGTIINSVPALGTLVARLRAEHREILLELEHLQALSQDRTKLYQLEAGLDSLFQLITAHEHAESLLLQEFFLHDEREAAH